MLASMKLNTTAMERAFELAKTGIYSSCSEIKLILTREGYGAEQIQGPALLRQLRSIIAASREDVKD